MLGRIDVDELGGTVEETVEDIDVDELEEIVEETKEDVEISTLVELNVFDVESEEDDDEELPAAWLLVKDALETLVDPIPRLLLVEERPAEPDG